MTPQERLQEIIKINSSGMSAKARMIALREFVDKEKQAEEDEQKQEDTADKELQAMVKSLTAAKKEETKYIGVMKGDKGDEGDDGHTPTNEELLSLIKPLIPNVKDGITPTKAELLKLIKPLIPKVKDGYTPVKGVDYFDGKDGVARTEVIVQEVLKLVKDPKTKEKLHIKNIDGVSELQDRIVNHAVTQARGLLYAGLLENRTTGSSGTGGYTVETPTGIVNSTNVTFTVTVVPVYIVSDNATYFENQGYTISGLTITMSVAPTNFIRSFHA